jgi:hypothetical protein
MSVRYFTLDAGLGDEREWLGNTVRPILVERVAQTWHDGSLIDETREIRESGKVALVMGCAS